MRSTGRNTISASGKAFALLDAFGPKDGTLTLSDLARRTRMPKSTAFRVVNDLVGWGGLERVNGRYRLGLHLFELGELVPRHRTLSEAALPFLEDLYEATHETVHLGVREGFDLVYLEKITGARGTRAPSRVGGRMALHSTGVGKAILAYSSPTLLEELIEQRGLERFTPNTITDPGRLRREIAGIKRDGVAYDREEIRVGLVCVAAPIMLKGRGVVGALSVAGPADTLRPQFMAPAVRMAGLTLSRQLRADYALLRPK